MQVLAANILMRISFVKIVCDCFLTWQKPGGDSLTFGTGVLMSSNFVRPPNNQTNFSTTSNNQLSNFEKNLTLKKCLGQWHARNIRPRIISPTPNFRPQITHLGPRNFRLQIISPPQNCRLQISTSAPPLQNSRTPSPGDRKARLKVTAFGTLTPVII